MFFKEKFEIMNFVFFVYGCCLDRLVKKIFIKKGLYSSDF